MSLPPGPAATPVPSVCLIVLDGWGLAAPGPGNAVSQATTPVFDELWSTYPHTQLTACGRAVGLPEGQMGNSEVGHLNLGAGSVVRQDLTRIDDAVADGSFATNAVLLRACEAGRASGRLHLLGLVSDGGVHSGFEHLQALIELALILMARACPGYFRVCWSWPAATHARYGAPQSQSKHVWSWFDV